MMQQPEEIQEELKPKRKVKPQVDQSEALSQLYEYVIWCGNAINQLNVTVAQLQQQITPYPPQNPPYQELLRTPPVDETPVNPNTPTFSKRTKVIDEEPERKVKPPWYRQKGIIFAIVLVILMFYIIYLAYAKSKGLTVTIPGLGKF
jgi:hypothetical protein